MTKQSVSERISKKLKSEGVRYWANDNISQYLTREDKHELIDELTEKFEGVLDSLIIDRETDPNSHGTARRLAKMYLNETMSGRYDHAPSVTSFPNDDPDTRYGGLIVIRAELKSLCSHHWQPVSATAYIGLLPSMKVIGLSKYIRISQHIARRGTLQENLTMDIADAIVKATGTKDVAVYIQGTHGCCENRGVMANSSLTQTCELRGQFFGQNLRQEFYDNIKMQQQFASFRG